MSSVTRRSTGRAVGSRMTIGRCATEGPGRGAMAAGDEPVGSTAALVAGVDGAGETGGFAGRTSSRCDEPDRGQRKPRDPDRTTAPMRPAPAERARRGARRGSSRRRCAAAADRPGVRERPVVVGRGGEGVAPPARVARERAQPVDRSARRATSSSASGSSSHASSSRRGASTPSRSSSASDGVAHRARVGEAVGRQRGPARGRGSRSTARRRSGRSRCASG